MPPQPFLFTQSDHTHNNSPLQRDPKLSEQEKTRDITLIAISEPLSDEKTAARIRSSEMTSETTRPVAILLIKCMLPEYTTEASGDSRLS